MEKSELTDEEQTILRALENAEPADTEGIAADTGMPVRKVRKLLVGLLTKGLILRTELANEEQEGSTK